MNAKDVILARKLGGGCGGAPVIQPLSVTANGTYTAPSGVDGYNPVTVNVGGTPIEVPNDYTQLEYLESSGTQLINTEYNPKLNSAAEIDVMFLNGTPQYGACFGTRNPWFMICADSPININEKKQVSFLTGFGSANNQKVYAPTNGKTKFKVTATATLVDDAIAWTNASPSLSESATKIGLFGRGEGTFKSPCRVYRYKYWENDVLLLDMLPAMRKSDSVLGMYDIVNGVFYTNVGTGTFVGGALT